MLSSMHPTPIAPYVPGVTRPNASCASTSITIPPKSAAKKSYVAHKRKRADMDTTDTDASASAGPKPQRDGPKKKKANRACLHCQKSHLTCDDSRPCQRCVKRGMADQCKEGHRKKAKYLLDEEEIEELGKGRPMRRGTSTGDDTPPPTIPEPRNVNPPPLSTSEPFPANDPIFNLPFDPTLAFGSEAANLEYSILSAILGNPDATSPLLEGGISSRVSPEPYAIGLVEGALGAPAPGVALIEGSPEPYMQGLHESVFSPLEQPLALPPPDIEDPLSSLTSYHSGPFSRAESPQLSITPSDTTLDGPRRAHDDFLGLGVESDLILRRVDTSTPPSPISVSSGSGSQSGWEGAPTARRALGKRSSVYENVTVAYDYTPGYHALMKYLPDRFEKEDILRIVRALAIVRPSLIALQMPLTEEDEVFVEKCFQRSLIEYEKLISFTGTPTVAWRRTGEICLVGVEFSLLTDWTGDQLVSSRKHIWEIFDNKSVVDYWEKFASHAFENTTQSVYSHCSLVKPTGETIPCTFCFSIRRDIFDLPSLVIGQWLPLK